jgi:integrase
VLCTFATGMRLGEICSLRWSQIDLNKKLINVESSEGFITKSKRCRVIPMNDMVLELLQRQGKNVLVIMHSIQTEKSILRITYRRLSRNMSSSPELIQNCIFILFGTDSAQF